MVSRTAETDDVGIAEGQDNQLAAKSVALLKPHSRFD